MVWDIHWAVLPAHTANPHTPQFLFWGTKQNRPFLILNSCISYGKQGNGTQSMTYCVLSSRFSAFFHKRHLLSSLHFKDGFLKVTQLICSGDGVWTHLSRYLNLLPPLLSGSPGASWAKVLFCKWAADPTTWKGGADRGGHKLEICPPSTLGAAQAWTQNKGQRLWQSEQASKTVTQSKRCLSWWVEASLEEARSLHCAEIYTRSAQLQVGNL